MISWYQWKRIPPKYGQVFRKRDSTGQIKPIFLSKAHATVDSFNTLCGKPLPGTAYAARPSDDRCEICQQAYWNIQRNIIFEGSEP